MELAKTKVTWGSRMAIYATAVAYIVGSLISRLSFPSRTLDQETLQE
jgi:hypothetical protein